MISVALLYPVEPASQRGAFICVMTWEMPPRQAGAGGCERTTAARLLVLSKN